MSADPVGSESEKQLRQACAELERRLRNGEDCRAEEFFTTFPALAAHEDTALDLIYAEYLARAERARQTLAEELCRRFPRWQDALRQQFLFEQWLHESLPDDTRPDGTTPPVPEDREAEESGRPEGWPRHYELLEEVARGGMGVLYKARQVSLNRLVALKMIRAGAHASREELTRFRTEAKAVACLQHPNIVQIYEVGEQDGHPFLALEYVDGGSLAQQLAGTPRPAREAARLVETLARAVHVAHRHGIVHRDLKPANVVLTADGTPKITDFGLAKRLHDPSAGATTAAPTGSAVILGTPSYMAPEQAGGRAAAVSPATDLYALGTILYEMLTGRPPFQAATPLDTLQRVRTEEPVPPSRLQPKVPRDLETICLKCLEKEPARRYPTAEALADDLARFREGRPVQARPVGPAARLGRWCRRRPVPAALAAALALVVVLGFAAVTWQWRRADDNFRRAEANFTEAERQRQQAEENFRQAFEAVADFTDVHRHPLLEAPRMRPVKKELFEKALKYYQSFVRQRGGDSALELELANAYVWTGSIVAILGSPAEALTAYEQARALYEKITTEQPDRDDLRALLAHCYCRLGWQQHLMERPDEALHWCRRACEILEQLAPTDCFLRIKGIKGSPDAWLKDRLVLARQALGGVHQARGEVPQAIAVYEQAARLGEELVREVPEEPGYGSRLIFTYQRLSELYRADNRPDQARQADQRAASLGPGPGATALPGTGLSATAAEQYHSLAREYRAANQLPEALQSYQRAVAVWEGMVQAGQVGLARSQWEVGEVYYALGQKPAALRTLQENCRLLEELVRQRPLDEKAQRLRAQSLYWLGKLLAESNQPAEAVHSYRSAAEVYEQMINAQPQDHSLRRTLAACYHNLGRLYADTGEPGSALGHYHRAVALREQLCRDEPAGVDHVSDLGGTWMRLGLLLEGLGRHEEAVQAFREAADKHREAARRAPGEERYLQQLHTDEQHLERLKRSAAPSR